MFILMKMDGLKPWWDGRCPSCGEYMTFLHGQDLAFCSWATCKAEWEVKYEYRNGKVDSVELKPWKRHSVGIVGFSTMAPPAYANCRDDGGRVCRHVCCDHMDFPCRECSRNSLNPIDRYESKVGDPGEKW